MRSYTGFFSRILAKAKKVRECLRKTQVYLDIQKTMMALPMMQSKRIRVMLMLRRVPESIFVG
jgi:hypothetical protein